MLGRNPLWVAKQHGHSISTMLSIYAAWVEGALEVDVETIRESMNAGAQRSRAEPQPTAGRAALPADVRDRSQIKTRRRRSREPVPAPGRRPTQPRAADPKCHRGFGSPFGSEDRFEKRNRLKGKEKTWRRGWDSNPRAGITRPSDFESAPL
jgi:hypothetical protein